MTICLFSYPLGSRGGVYQWTVLAAELLASHSQVVVVTGSRPDPTQAATWDWHGIKTMHVDLPRRPSVSSARFLRGLMEDRGVETLITSQLYASVCGAMLRTELKWHGQHVAVVHSAIAGGFLRARYYSFELRRLSSGCDGVAVVGPHLAQNLSPSMRRRAVVVPTWVTRPDAVMSRRKGSVRFAYVGRLEPGKGIDIVLECARRMPENSVHIYGDGSLREHIERQASSLPNVWCAGWVDDLEAVWPDIDVLLLPSEAEGWPLIVGEASVRGVPVLVREIEPFVGMEYPGELMCSSEPDFVDRAVQLSLTDGHGSTALGDRMATVAERHFSGTTALAALREAGVRW